MANKIKFEIGDFIKQDECKRSFAIFGGDLYNDKHYSLICYYNPNHYEKDSNGMWDSKCIFECDLDDGSVCEYAIADTDLDHWRLCTKDEVEAAHSYLKNVKGLEWNEKELKLVKAPTYRERFGGYNDRLSVRPTQTVPLRHKITLTVSEDWVQKNPLESMSIELKELLLKQCEKITFNTFYDGVGVYRTNFWDAYDEYYD